MLLLVGRAGRAPLRLLRRPRVLVLLGRLRNEAALTLPRRRMGVQRLVRHGVQVVGRVAPMRVVGGVVRQHQRLAAQVAQELQRPLRPGRPQLNLTSVAVRGVLGRRPWGCSPR